MKLNWRKRIYNLGLIDVEPINNESNCRISFAFPLIIFLFFDEGEIYYIKVIFGSEDNYYGAVNTYVREGSIDLWEYVDTLLKWPGGRELCNAIYLLGIDNEYIEELNIFSCHEII